MACVRDTLCDRLLYLRPSTEVFRKQAVACRREAATICLRRGMQVVARYTSYTHLDPLLTPCPYGMLAGQYSQPKRPGDLDL